MFFETVQQQTHLLIQQMLQNQTVTRPTVILGFSGGPDSVFLFHVLKDLHHAQHMHLITAHLDHGWRASSAGDATFCLTTSASYEIPCVVAKAEMFEGMVKDRGSKEDFGRSLRRLFFQQTLQKYTAHCIALAHHLQDQEETFFLRLLRGASLSGLRCMEPIDGHYIRPLLALNKRDILQFLNDNNHAYCTDPTNDSDEFLRNKIRKYVIPALTKCDDRFDHKFQTTLALLKQEDDFLQEVTHKAFEQIFIFDEKLMHHKGNLRLLQTHNLTLQQRIILHWLITEKAQFSLSTSFLQEIMRFLASPHGGSHHIGTLFTIHKKHNTLWIEQEITQPYRKKEVNEARRS